MSGASRASTDSRESRASSRSSTVSPARRKAASRFGRGEPRSAAKSRREGTASSRAARGRTSPVRIASSGADQGLSVWKLICRHYSVSLVGVLIAAAALLQLPVNAAARRRRDMGGETTRYDLGGKPLFRDSGSTIGLTEFAGGEAGSGLPRREKRSVRRAREKEERQRPE